MRGLSFTFGRKKIMIEQWIGSIVLGVSFTMMIGAAHHGINKIKKIRRGEL